jgi:cystathionine beta-lyase
MSGEHLSSGSRVDTHAERRRRHVTTDSDFDFDFDRRIERRGTDSLKWHDPQGRELIPLWVADMDFAVPPCVLRALRARIDHGVFGYAVPTSPVVQAVVQWAARHYQWWLPGLVPGLHLACRALAEAEDEVLVLVPVYPPFLSAARMTGRQLTAVPLARDGNRWTIDFDALREAITPRTRLLMFCHPHNPVGRAFSRDELAAVANFCATHNLLVCSDEIHCDLRLEPGPHVPLATVDDTIAARTVTLMSPAKTFNLSGLCCGFAIVPNAELRRRFQSAGRDIVSHPNALAYAACRAAYEEGEAWRSSLLAYLRRNRDLLVSFLAEQLPDICISPVEATYLAWLDTRALGPHNTLRFFEQAGVRLSDGQAFLGPGFMRLNFGCPQSTLTTALERIRAAVATVL